MNDNQFSHVSDCLTGIFDFLGFVRVEYLPYDAKFEALMRRQFAKNISNEDYINYYEELTDENRENALLRFATAWNEMFHFHQIALTGVGAQLIYFSTAKLHVPE